MIDKRFIAIGVDGDNVWFKDTMDNKEYTTNYETVDLLNTLNSKNQELLEVFEQVMEDAFDKYMDSSLAEEVIDYIHSMFYDSLCGDERYTALEYEDEIYPVFFDKSQDGKEISTGEVVDLLNQYESLRLENQMLRTTIARNESYINRLKSVNPWNNTAK